MALALGPGFKSRQEIVTGQEREQKGQMFGRQQRLAEEQWEWQKRLYGEQAEATKGAQGSMERMVEQYNRAYQEARTANEERYRQMLGITGQTTQQRAADIRGDYAGQSANIMQQLARQGMAGTTVAPTMQMGVEREKQASLNRLADMMQGTKLGIMERREDKYPDPNILMSLAQMVGRGGAGAGMAGALSGIQVGSGTTTPPLRTM